MDFKPIDISMKQMVEHYTAKWKLECSEYTFSNLLMWGCGGNIMLAEDEQALYILLHWGNASCSPRLRLSPSLSIIKPRSIRRRNT